MLVDKVEYCGNEKASIWHVVEECARNLKEVDPNASESTIVLKSSHEQSLMIVAFASSYGYYVSCTAKPDLQEKIAVNPFGTSNEVNVLIGGQGTPVSECLFINEESAMIAIRHFFYNSSRTPELLWVTSFEVRDLLFSKTEPAYLRRLLPDKILGSIIGNEVGTRSEISRRLYQYFRTNNRIKGPLIIGHIEADEKLLVLFDSRDKIKYKDVPEIINQHTSYLD